MLSRRSLLRLAAAAAGAYALGGLARGGGLDVALVDAGLHSRAAVATDLPLPSLRPPRDLLEALAELRPRLLILGGDLVDRLTPGPLEALRGLRGLSALAGETLAVPGNHEHWLVNHGRLTWSDLEEALEEAGIGLYRDAVVEAQGLRVALIDWHWPPRRYQRIIDSLGWFELAAVHSPDAFHHATRGAWAAGHTHGGQVCLPGARSLVTNSVYGYTWGLYRRREAMLYVSRGLGEMLPPRLYCPRQLVVLE